MIARRQRRRTVLIAALMGALVISSASGAAAWGSDSEDSSNPPPVTTQPVKPPVGGGGGGGSAAPSQYMYWTFSSASSNPGLSAQVNGCSLENGLGGSIVGVKYTYKYPAKYTLSEVQDAVRSEDSMRAMGVTALKPTCLYSGKYKTESLKCVISSTATVWMILPHHQELATQTTLSAYGRGDRSIEACSASATRAAVDITPSEYGRYHASAYSTVVDIRVRSQYGANELTGAVEAPRIISTTAEYRTYPKSADGYLTCNGWSDGIPGSTYSWTANDCPAGPGDPGAFQCVVGGDPAISWRGETWRGSSAELLRDGGDVTFEWDVPTITGSGLQGIVSTRSRMAVSDVPWTNSQPIASNYFGLQRDGARQNALNGADGTAWSSALTTNWTAQWYQATTYPTVLTPQYGFTADYVKNSVQITGVGEGGFIATPVQVVVRADASCSGVPVAVSTLRVVNG